MESNYVSRTAFRTEQAKRLFDSISSDLAFALDRAPRYGRILVSLGIHGGRLVKQSIETEKLFRLTGESGAPEADEGGEA